MDIVYHCGMTPEEEIELIYKINDDLEWYLEMIPNIDYGDTYRGRTIRLRENIKGGEYGAYTTMSRIIMELQIDFHRRKKRNPNIDKLIVSDVQLTPTMYNQFNSDSDPIKGLMINMLYVEKYSMVKKVPLKKHKV
jgi:hypothetical protein